MLSQTLKAACAILLLLSTSLKASACGKSPMFGLISLASEIIAATLINASLRTFQFLSDSSDIKDSVI